MLVMAGMALAFIAARAAAQARSISRMISSLEPVRREATGPVAAHTSAQPRLRRMHCLSCWTMSSPRQASAHEVQVCAQE